MCQTCHIFVCVHCSQGQSGQWPYRNYWKCYLDMLATDQTILIHGHGFYLCHRKQRTVRWRLVQFLVRGGPWGGGRFGLRLGAVPPPVPNASSAVDYEDGGGCRCAGRTACRKGLVRWPAATFPQSAEHQNRPADKHSQHHVTPGAVVRQRCREGTIWCRKCDFQTSNDMFLRHAIKMCWGSGGIAPYILNPALDGSGWSASRPGPFTPGGNNPHYPLDRRLGGPQSRSGRGGEEKKSQPLPGIEPVYQNEGEFVSKILSKILFTYMRREDEWWKEKCERCILRKQQEWWGELSNFVSLCQW